MEEKNIQKHKKKQKKKKKYIYILYIKNTSNDDVEAETAFYTCAVLKFETGKVMPKPKDTLI